MTVSLDDILDDVFSARQIDISKDTKRWFPENVLAQAKAAVALTEIVEGTEHETYALRLNALGVALLEEGEYSEAENTLRKALTASRKTHGEQSPHIAVQLENLARVVREQGRLEEAEGLHRQALAAATQANQGREIVTVNQGYSIEQHEAFLERGVAEQKEFLERAHGAERQLLMSKITDLEAKLANPEASLKEAQKRIADLEALLDREGNEIGADRIEVAKVAMEAGDYGLADDIFAEIEAREETAVKIAARASYSRGEVAEVEIRWHDAYTHYKRAALLHETIEHLDSYAGMARKLAKGSEALEATERLLSLTKEAYGEQSQDFATQLNNFALVLGAQGRFEEAENLVRQALQTDARTIGSQHPDYAVHLNNLASVHVAQGRFEEAEGLYRQALEIDANTIGEGHPDYATHLNNLAGVLEAKGQYAEAEKLYREALGITAKAIGTAHPDYATRLNNLALVLVAQGQYAEGETYYRRAIDILEARLGAEHPHTIQGRKNLEDLLAQSKP